ncbi:uncharacterized protein DS421_13g414810 [Arachis hypogaea]|nr:uncharacterized protein DS421_13g414810 [Arachis hypogaea]
MVSPFSINKETENKERRDRRGTQRKAGEEERHGLEPAGLAVTHGAASRAQSPSGSPRRRPRQLQTRSTMELRSYFPSPPASRLPQARPHRSAAAVTVTAPSSFPEARVAVEPRREERPGLNLDELGRTCAAAMPSSWTPLPPSERPSPLPPSELAVVGDGKLNHSQKRVQTATSVAAGEGSCISVFLAAGSGYVTFGITAGAPG